MTPECKALAEAARKLKFGAYPAHGSGFVHIVVEGNIDELREALATYDAAQAKGMSNLTVGKLSKDDRFNRSVEMAFETGKDEGAAAERAKIVAMLKHESNYGPVGAQAACRYVLAMIERGDHE